MCVCVKEGLREAGGLAGEVASSTRAWCAGVRDLCCGCCDSQGLGLHMVILAGQGAEVCGVCVCVCG